MSRLSVWGFILAVRALKATPAGSLVRTGVLLLRELFQEEFLLHIEGGEAPKRLARRAVRK